MTPGCFGRAPPLGGAKDGSAGRCWKGGIREPSPKAVGRAAGGLEGRASRGAELTPKGGPEEARRAVPIGAALDADTRVPTPALFLSVCGDSV